MSTQPEISNPEVWNPIEGDQPVKARERLFNVSFQDYRDKVIPFLQPEDQKYFDSEAVWDEICLKVDHLIAGGLRDRSGD